MQLPELKESENEMIKNAILNHLKKMWGNSQDDVCGVHVEDAIAWLEKQGEYLENYDDAEKEKADFVGDGFIECHADFLDFKEGNTYWLEYIGDDKYNVRSDNLLCKTYHITPCQLYTVFKKLTWLEKQGKQETLCDKCRKDHPSHSCQDITELGRCAVEHEPADKVEPKFNIGDWVVNKFGDSWHIDSLDKKNYRVSDGKGNYNYFPISKQDEMHIWTIQDAKDSDILAFSNDTIVIFKDLYNSTSFHSYCHIEDGIFDFNKDEVPDWWNSRDFKPATKEQRDILFQKIKEAGYNWNFETKTLEKLVEPKFNPKTLKPFDRVLTRDSNSEKWHCNYFSYIDYGDIYFPYATSGGAGFAYCIPYNEDTQHLVGTCDEPADYYKYWKE